MTLKAVPFFTQLNDHELDVVRSVAFYEKAFGVPATKRRPAWRCTE